MKYKFLTPTKDVWQYGDQCKTGLEWEDVFTVLHGSTIDDGWGKRRCRRPIKSVSPTSPNIRLLARDRAQIFVAVACGWCSAKNSNKVMDVELAEAIVDELLRQLQQA